jgi:hypothetical protein
VISRSIEEYLANEQNCLNLENQITMNNMKTEIKCYGHMVLRNLYPEKLSPQAEDCCVAGHPIYPVYAV